jgi:signal transduction histidine kinase
MSAARDITHRKQLENTLQEKKAELEKALLNKDQFLASLAFELRTGLNDVIGYTDVLLMGLPGELAEEQSEQLRIIRASAEHLLSLISLLELAEIRSDKVALNIEPEGGPERGAA